MSLVKVRDSSSRPGQNINCIDIYTRSYTYNLLPLTLTPQVLYGWHMDVIRYPHVWPDHCPASLVTAATAAGKLEARGDQLRAPGPGIKTQLSGLSPDRVVTPMIVGLCKYWSPGPALDTRSGSNINNQFLL